MELIRLINILPIALFMAFTSCINEEIPEVIDHQFSNRSMYILNEGNFMYENASLSLYLIDSMKNVNNVFYRWNGFRMGDVAQSITLKDSLGYLVVNNSGKILIVNTKTNKYVGKITGFNSPRYLHFVSDTKAYVSDLYNKAISIVDIPTRSITGYISVDNGAEPYQHATEHMVSVGNNVYVSCWSYDNKVLVINSETDAVVDSIETLKQPNSMVVDENENIWVLCDGGFDGSAYGQGIPGLQRINSQTNKIEQTLPLPLDEYPTSLCVNATGDSLYFINGSVWALSIYDITLPATPLIESPYASGFGNGFYGLAIDPQQNEIYVTDAIDGMRQGKVYRYTSTGELIDFFTVGILPNEMVFIPE